MVIEVTSRVFTMVATTITTDTIFTKLPLLQQQQQQQRQQERQQQQHQQQQ